VHRSVPLVEGHPELRRTSLTGDNSKDAAFLNPWGRIRQGSDSFKRRGDEEINETEGGGKRSSSATPIKMQRSLFELVAQKVEQAVLLFQRRSCAW